MPFSKHPNEIKINPTQGGKAAIERLVEAYGFTTRQALADHLDVSKSTLANRYMRDTFPADWIIQCALETGIFLNWLTFRQGVKQSSKTSTTEELAQFSFNAGKMIEDGSCVFDTSFLPTNLSSPIVVGDGRTIYICDRKFTEVLDGHLLINVDGSYSVSLITRLPKGMIKIPTAKNSFECAFSDIEVIVSIRSTTVSYLFNKRI
ncbi:phage repressor protein CI [Siccibacter colletis]|uniref:Phage repressor protein CI n=1 Tax=Siccibacter colletis TaxID=1505757 RepID=A0ABY6JKL9_9ENTR|nr:phage repressor protein CI [Siccibacter colletis]UYU33123.1 phage repressor protein CI [Siccibacter colletis]